MVDGDLLAGAVKFAQGIAAVRPMPKAAVPAERRDEFEALLTEKVGLIR